MKEWYANAQDEESDEGWEESIPLEVMVSLLVRSLGGVPDLLGLPHRM